MKGQTGIINLVLTFVVYIILFILDLRCLVLIICRFHVTGYITSFGSLEWAKTHDAATQTSLVVSSLVDGGAMCVGKTVIDEMAFR